MIGNNELDFVLADRDKIASEIEKLVDEGTKDWGWTSPPSSSRTSSCPKT